MPQIHPSAIVDPQAQLGQGVSVGPFCVIEGDVQIGAGCRLEARAIVKDGTRLGKENIVCEGAVLGGKPQHLRAGSELGQLIVGNGNQIRENVTIHRGLTPDDRTTLGDSNLIMVGAHIAHDCHVGNHTILANNVMLAGHIVVEDRAYLSGAVGVHQFCRIGSLAMVGGQAHVKQDVPPFMTVDGYSSQIVGLNKIGLKRAGFSQDDIDQLMAAYRLMYRSELPWSEIVNQLNQRFTSGPAAQVVHFLDGSRRGFIQARNRGQNASLKLHRDSMDADELKKAS